jgi:hypothetical protein
VLVQECSNLPNFKIQRRVYKITQTVPAPRKPKPVHKCIWYFCKINFYSTFYIKVSQIVSYFIRIQYSVSLIPTSYSNTFLLLVRPQSVFFISSKTPDFLLSNKNKIIYMQAFTCRLLYSTSGRRVFPI